VGATARIERWKWGGRPHYCYSMTTLGEDEFGVWLWAPAGNTITRGDTSFDTRNATLAVVPRVGMWSAGWWQAHDEIELYVDINTSPEWVGDTVSMTDLDLDIIRFVDGRVEIVDQDEFAEHQVAFGYPEEIIDAAQRAAGELHARVEARTEPFDDAWRRWLPVERLGD
jgi:protein associated with RNAse G/E